VGKVAAQLEVQYGSTGVEKTAADARSLGGVIDDVGRKGGWLGTAIGTGVGVLAAGAITKGIDLVRGFGGSLLTTAGDAEQMHLALETVTGSQEKANKLFGDLQQFAKDTPFAFPEIAQASINLEAFGLHTQDWITTIGDTASAMGKSVDQVTQAVLDAQTGQYERLKELGVSASVEGDKLTFSYMKNGEQIKTTVDRTNQDVINSTLQGIWNDKYAGAMEKQSRSFNGMWSTLQDNWNMTLQRMTGGVFDFAKEGLTHANLFFDRLNVGLDRGMGTFDATMRAVHFTLQDVFGKSTGNTIFAGIDGIATGLKAGANAGVGVIRFVDDLYDSYKRLRNLAPTGVMSSLGILGPDGELFVSQMGRMQAITTILGTQFTRLTGIKADQWFERMGKAIIRYPDALKKTGAALLDIGRAFQDGGLHGAFDAIFGHEGQTLVSGLFDLWSAGPKLIGDFFKGIDTGIPKVDKLALTVGNLFTDIGRLGQELGQGDWSGFLDVLDRTGDHLGDLGGQVVDLAISLGAGAISAGEDLLGWVSDHTDTIKVWIEQGWDGAVKLTKLTLSAAVDGASDLKGWISAHIGTLKGWLESGWDGAVTVSKIVFNAAVDGASDLKGWIGAHLDTVTGWLKSGWTGIVDLGNIAATVAEVTIKGDTNGTSIGSKIGNALHDAVSDLPDIGQGLASGAASAISDFDFVGWFDDTQNAGAAVHDFVVGIGSFVGGAIEDAFTMLVNNPGDVIKTVGGVAVGAAGAAPAFGLFIGQSIGNFLFGAITGMDADEFSLADFTGDLAGKIWDAISGAVSDAFALIGGGGLGSAGALEGSPGQQRGATAGIDISGMITDWITGALGDAWDTVSGIDNPFSGLTGSIQDWVTSAIPTDWGFVDTAFSGLVSKLSSIWDTVDGWIKRILDRSDDADDQPKGDPKKTLTSTEGGGGTGINPPGTGLPWGTGQPSDGESNLPWGNGEPSNGGNNTPWGGQDIVFHVDADTSPAQKAINDLKGLFGGGSGQKVGPGGSDFKIPVDVEIDRSKAGADLQTMIDSMKGDYKVKIGADLAPLQDALGVAMKIGVAWNSATFDQAIFGAQYTLVDQASQVSWVLGTTWADSTHEATFTADPSGVDRASAAAWLLGANWDGRVFTASLAVNTDALAAAEARVLQFATTVSNLLPHSPAKVGPLSRPISFSYLAQDLADTMGLMGPIAERGMAGVAGAMSGTSGILSRLPVSAGIGRGMTLTQHVYQVTPQELVELMEEARAGGDVAKNLATELQLQRHRSTV
jgi:hypothetical protein